MEIVDATLVIEEITADFDGVYPATGECIAMVQAIFGGHAVCKSMVALDLIQTWYLGFFIGFYFANLLGIFNDRDLWLFHGILRP